MKLVQGNFLPFSAEDNLHRGWYLLRIAISINYKSSEQDFYPIEIEPAWTKVKLINSNRTIWYTKIWYLVYVILGQQYLKVLQNGQMITITVQSLVKIKLFEKSCDANKFNRPYFQTWNAYLSYVIIHFNI